MNFSINKRIGVQVGIWGLIWLGLPYFVLGSEVPESVSRHSFTLYIGVVLIILINTKILFPKLYKRKQFRIYGLSAFIVVIALGLLIGKLGEILSDDKVFLPFNQDPNHVRSEILARLVPFRFVMPIFVGTLISTIIEIGILANEKTKETIQLKSEKLETELKFLKSQINPHFLFNSLNNIYTLTVIEPKAAGESLLKLSEMLRYLLYECDAAQVPLNKELAYLQNYIDLFILKDEEALNITFDYEEVNQELMIAPLLLIPFVENAFKHSYIEDLENGWIDIQISCVSQTILFEVSNSLPKRILEKDRVGGIGLQNVKRQLELLYPNKHCLKINSEEEKFSIQLELQV